MAVKASGSSLSFSEIENEFGQNSDRDLGEYRVSQTVGGLSSQPLDTGIPQSGAIKFSDFYSKRLNVIIDYHSGSTENRPSDARTKYQAGSTSGNRTIIGGFRDRISGNSAGSKVRIHVNKTIGSAVGDVNNCAIRTGSFETGTVVTVEVGSSGQIFGAGGNGGEAGTSDGDRNGDNGGNGSSGLGVQFNGTTVINNGTISAGFGGGGGGGYRKVEREESFGGPVYAASGGGGGGGQGLPAGEGGGEGGADGTTTAGGNGGNGGENNQAHGGGGGGGGSNGSGGEGGNSNDGGNGTSSSGGNGASGTHTGSIEGENNVTGSGGSGGSNGAAIRRTSGITVNITNNATITGADDATGVA